MLINGGIVVLLSSAGLLNIPLTMSSSNTSYIKPVRCFWVRRVSDPVSGRATTIYRAQRWDRGLESSMHWTTLSGFIVGSLKWEVAMRIWNRRMAADHVTWNVTASMLGSSGWYYRIDKNEKCNFDGYEIWWRPVFREREKKRLIKIEKEKFEYDEKKEYWLWKMNVIQWTIKN